MFRLRAYLGKKTLVKNTVATAPCRCYWHLVFAPDSIGSMLLPFLYVSYNLACIAITSFSTFPSASIRAPAHPSAHSIIPSTSASTSAGELLACKHTRMRSAPFGTVGHVIGRALRPRARRCAESGRGCGVRTGMMGVAGEGACEGEEGLGGRERWRGRRRSAGEICRVASSRRKVVRKYELRSRSLPES